MRFLWFCFAQPPIRLPILKFFALMLYCFETTISPLILAPAPSGAGFFFSIGAIFLLAFPCGPIPVSLGVTSDIK
nr:MAG TPA: hypothetical protein [Caudoviricetes sp.]